MIFRRKPKIAKGTNPKLPAILTLLLLTSPFYQSLNSQTSTFYFLFHDPEWGFSNSIEAIERLSPFCDFLSETLNKRISPLYLKQQNDIEGHLSTPEVLFGLLNANVVSQKQDKFALKPFLLPVRKGEITNRKVLLIPSHLKVKDISELEGKRLAVLTSDNYNLQEQLSLVTSKEFVDPYRFFGSIVKAASTESAISSFRLNLSDCALVAMDSFELAQQKNPDLKEQIKILYLSPPMTNSPVIQIGKRLSPDEKLKLQAALLSLPESESGRKLLRLIYVDAFQKTPRQELIKKPSPTREPEQETIYHVIKKGDTLWDLAEKFLGSGRQYQIIADINQIKNPHKIRVGKKLKIIKQKKSAD
jgi:ABC-type phosphate/phosphonate transport system substrate-binding protein